MSFKALVYAYIIGGFTFLPLIIATAIFYTIYSSIPVKPSDPTIIVIDKDCGQTSPDATTSDEQESAASPSAAGRPPGPGASDLNDIPKQRRGWLTVRRTFEESSFDGSYVTLMRSLLDSRSKDPKKSRPRDLCYAALKGKVLYLYEDEAMTECEAAIELGGHDVIIYPEGLLDGELFARRNAICLKPKASPYSDGMPGDTKEMMIDPSDDGGNEAKSASQETIVDEKKTELSGEQVVDASTPWFIFVRSNIEMEDWYLALIHASDHPANSPTLDPLQPIFDPSDMAHLVETLDEQPDVIPMRWLNALIGRVFFSYYRTHVLEEYIIGRLMKKLSKVKRPAFLTDFVVTEVSVGNTAPVLSKPMLKELTKEGDASLEVHLQYTGEVRVTAQAVVTINLGARFKSYSVKLVLAVVLREIEGNMLVKVKRPPSNRIWYAFTQPPRMVLDVEPVVSDRQITWNMVLSTIEARLKEIIHESIVMPNMDDVAFFQSSDYNHRGGIWSDALRREKDTTPDSDPTQSIPPSFDEGAPVASTSSTPAVILPVQDIKHKLKHAHSAEELRKQDPSLIPDTTTVRAITSVTSSPASTSTTSKRRSWFSSVLGEETGSDSDEGSENVSRGRATNPITPSSSRSASSSSDLQNRPKDEFLSPKRPPPLPPRTPPAKDSSEAPTSTPPRSPQFSRTNTTSNNSTTTSFFSTLKARAGDKQALSNSAKEAMKKWSANWSALRRDNVEDSSDPGGHDRNNSDSDLQNKGTSYASIRKNVEDRQKTIGVIEPGDTRQIDTPDARVTNQQRGLRAPSISGPLAPSPHLAERSASTSSDRRDGLIPIESHASLDDTTREADVEVLSPLPIHTQPPQAKTMTIPGIHASHRGEVMSLGYVAEPLQPPESKSKTQGVYRLWKNPASSNQQQNQETEYERSREPDASSSRPKPPPVPPRNVPPPLPPRFVSTNIIRPMKTPGTFPDSLDTSASAALKSIATQDESRRVSVDRGDALTVSQVDPAPAAHSSALG